VKSTEHMLYIIYIIGNIYNLSL